MWLSRSTFGGLRPSASEPVNATINTAEAAAIANTSTVSEMRADNRMPRIISVSATAPTTTASTAIVTAPAGTPIRPSSAVRYFGRTQRARHRGRGVTDDQPTTPRRCRYGAKPLDRVAVQPTDRDHPRRELADAVPDRRHQQRRDRRIPPASTAGGGHHQRRQRHHHRGRCDRGHGLTQHLRERQLCSLQAGHRRAVLSIAAAHPHLPSSGSDERSPSLAVIDSVLMR